MKSKMLMLAGLLVALTMAMGPVAAHAKGGGTKTDLRAKLMGTSAFPSAKGEARFTDDGKGTRKFSASVKNTGLPAGTMISVFANGSQIGAAVPVKVENENEANDNEANPETDEASISLTSKKGATLPALTAGSAVQWETADGTVIASGTLATH